MPNAPEKAVEPQHYLRRELLYQFQTNPIVFDFLGNATLDGMWYLDLTDPEHEWMDERFWRTLGYDPTTKPHLTSAWQDLIHPDDLGLAMDNLTKHLQDPAYPYDQVVRYTHADGSTVWVRCRGMALRDSSGTPIRMLGAHVNVTASVLAKQKAEEATCAIEQLLSDQRVKLDSALDRLANARLMHEQQRAAELKQLIDGLPLLVWTCTSDGQCDYLSEQWVEYTGIPEREQLGSAWIEQIEPDDVPGLTSAWAAAVASGSPFDVEFRIRRQDGQYRWFKTRATPIRNERGDIERWVGSNTDIHDLRVLESVLRERTSALERSNAELEQFAYVASHDLQEPLRTITNYVQLLDRRYRGLFDERGHTYMDFVVAGAKRMKELITDLLNYSRATTGDETLGECDASAALETAITSLASLFNESGAQLSAAPLPRVRIREPALVRIFQNLLANAIRYTEKSAPQIEVNCARADGFATLSVKDDGVGIAKEHHARIFQMFQRLHSPQRCAGTGVGLAICRRLVAAVDGDIWVESERGKGATFYIKLSCSS